MKITCGDGRGAESAIAFADSINATSRITSQYPPNHRRVFEQREGWLPNWLPRFPLRPVASSRLGYL